MNPFDSLIETRKTIVKGKFFCRQDCTPRGPSVNIVGVAPDHITVLIGVSDTALTIRRDSAGVLARFFATVEDILE